MIYTIITNYKESYGTDICSFYEQSGVSGNSTKELKDAFVDGGDKICLGVFFRFV